MYLLSTPQITELVIDKIAEMHAFGADKVLLSNPSTAAVFPCCIVSPPLQNTRDHGVSYVLSFTVEVWADKQYEAMRLFDSVRGVLFELNMKLTGSTATTQDHATRKWRYGGYFECRYNALLNTIDRN